MVNMGDNELEDRVKIYEIRMKASILDSLKTLRIRYRDYRSRPDALSLFLYDYRRQITELEHEFYKIDTPRAVSS